MGHIKEPIGINFVVDPKPLTIIEREGISEIIAFYKKTGKKKSITNSIEKRRTNSLRKKKELV
jgi:hypothetical protein